MSNVDQVSNDTLFYYEGIGVNVDLWAMDAEWARLSRIFTPQFLNKRKQEWCLYHPQENFPIDITGTELLEDYNAVSDGYAYNGVIAALISQDEYLRKLVSIIDIYGDDYLFVRESNAADYAYLVDKFGQEYVQQFRLLCDYSN